MGVVLDSNLLLAAINAKLGLPTNSSGSTGAAGSTSARRTNPTPPWAAGVSTATQWDNLTRHVLNGGRFIDVGAAKLDVPGGDATTTQNYKNLFALYQGLTALQGLAQKASVKGISATEQASIDKTFKVGLQQVQDFLQGSPFKGFQVYQTDVSATAKSAFAPSETDTYSTGVLYQGGINDAVPAFQGTVQFDLTVTRLSGAQTTISFDLAEMGSTTRSMGNVVAYMNSKLQAVGMATRFASVMTPGAPETVQAGGQNITLGTGPDQYSLKINGTSAESLSFSAPASDPAVYLAQTSGIATGNTPDAVQEFAKFEAGSGSLATLGASGQVFRTGLSQSVDAVRAMATAADGSVYALQDVTGSAGGQVIQGTRDVALVKYDSAGHVVFTRTLGASGSASGFALTVSADGSQVAIAGSVKGELDPTAVSTSSNSSTPPADSFVTVFGSKGEELWTQQTGTPDGSAVQANAVAFGPNGMVYVAGQTDGKLAGAAASAGRTDAFVQAFHATSTPLNDGSGGVQWTAVSTQVEEFGTGSMDRATGLAVSGGSVYVSSVEGGHAVVRRFDQSGAGSTSLTAFATRDLGDLQGGSVAGLAVNNDGSIVVAGSTHNGALNGGTVTQAYAGGEAAFVADLASDLVSAPSETLTYLGDGTNDQTASAVTVSGGKVYIAGQIATAPAPGTDQTSGHDGYMAAVDPLTGAVTWTQRILGLDRQAAPTTIAVGQDDATVLDRLGLPNGPIDYAVSDKVVANTSLRPGDKFYVKTGSSTLGQAVTIEANDTYQTLALKIARASGFSASATVIPGSAGSQIEIKPLSANRQIALAAGPEGQDALAALGLAEGVISVNAAKESDLAPAKHQGANPPTSSLKNGYSLKLPSTLDLTGMGDINAAQSVLNAAVSKVRLIYQDMINPPLPKSGAKGTVPKYLQDQISNYQAALNRLTGGAA